MVQIISVNSIGTGVRFTAGNAAFVILTQGTLLGSTNSDAIVVGGSDNTVVLDGQLIGGGSGLALGSGGIDTFNQVHIGQTGVVRGDSAAIFIRSSSNTVVNHGQLFGLGAGIRLIETTEGTGDRIVNFGTIAGNIAIEHAGGAVGSLFTLINRGSLVCGDSGIAFFSFGFASNETIRNSGVILGNILFGAGSDLYDGRGGTIDGTVWGQDDNDTFIAGLSNEVFDGGAGTDLLDFSKSAAVTVSLGNDVQGSRGADGDTYANIENLTGSRFGADNLFGDSGGNVLSGLGGVDTINGGNGFDTLIGGTGKDVLTGGFNNDAFVFNTLAECGDTITDFSALAVINDDVIRINAAAFGGGLVAGALNPNQLQFSTNTVASTASVRFIFNSTDKSLWFDANGAAAGGLTMVADLQASAVFGISDILLV